MVEADEHGTSSGRGTRSASPRVILLALRHEIEGFEVAERDVELSAACPGLRAHWVGTDGSGRKILAAVRDEGDKAAILWAVEAVACARDASGLLVDGFDDHADGEADGVDLDRVERNGHARPAEAVDPRAEPPSTQANGHLPIHAAELASGFRGADRDPIPPPLVILIVPRCSPRLMAALTLLPAGSLDLFEMVSRGAGARGKPTLMRRELHVPGGRAVFEEAQAQAWSAPAREMAASLAHRVRRIDPKLEHESRPSRARWTWRGEECAALSSARGRLIGTAVPGLDFKPIEDEAEAEAWLEQLLREHVARLGSHPRVARPVDLLARGGPLLSAEELAAFHDDV